MQSSTAASSEQENLTTITAIGEVMHEVRAEGKKVAREFRQLLTLDDDDLAAWMKQDTLIVSGYRGQLNSFYECLCSLFYVHNEFVNTWSHLAPGIIYVALLLIVDCETFRKAHPIASADFYVIQIYVVGTICSLLLSALYHGTNAHSQKVARHCLKLDYLGIVLTISTTAVSSTYFGLHNDPKLQGKYIGITVLCATAVFLVVLRPQADGSNAAAWRATVFSSLALSGFAPIVHVACTRGFTQLGLFPLPTILMTCSCYLLGTAIYVSRIPERYWRGFDTWGASHQYFHILVALGQGVHLIGLLAAAMNLPRT